MHKSAKEIKSYSYTFPYRDQRPFTIEVDYYFIFPRFVNTVTSIVHSISKVATFPRWRWALGSCLFPRWWHVCISYNSLQFNMEFTLSSNVHITNVYINRSQPSEPITIYRLAFEPFEWPNQRTPNLHWSRHRRAYIYCAVVVSRVQLFVNFVQHSSRTSGAVQRASLLPPVPQWMETKLLMLLFMVRWRCALMLEGVIIAFCLMLWHKNRRFLCRLHRPVISVYEWYAHYAELN
jgi:hypothetical protein